MHRCCAWPSQRRNRRLRFKAVGAGAAVARRQQKAALAFLHADGQRVAQPRLREKRDLQAADPVVVQRHGRKIGDDVRVIRVVEMVVFVQIGKRHLALAGRRQYRTPFCQPFLHGDAGDGKIERRYCERQRRGTENRALFKIQQRPQRRRRGDLLAAGEKQKLTDERSALQPVVDRADGHNVLVAQRPLEFHGQPRDDEHHVRFAHLGVGGAVGIAVLPRNLLHIFLQRRYFDHPVRVYVVAFDFDCLFKHCRLQFLLLLLGQRIGFHRRLQLLVGDMGVNLRGAELFMAEDVLERAHVDVALVIHQRGRRVAQLVRGIPFPKTDLCEMLFHHPLHGFVGNAIAAAAEKQRVRVGDPHMYGGLPDLKVSLERIAAGGVEVDRPHFRALAGDGHFVHIRGNVRKADADQLGKPYAAIEKQRENRVVARIGVVGLLHRVDQLNALVQTQILGFTRAELRRVDVFRRVLIQNAGFVRVIFEERPQRGELPRAGARVVAAVMGEVKQKFIDVRLRDADDERLVDVVDGQPVDVLRAQVVPLRFHISEKGAQVVGVFRHGQRRTVLHRLLVRKELYDFFGHALVHSLCAILSPQTARRQI